MRAVKIAALVGVLTSPLNVLAYFDRDMSGLIRMCQVRGWACADQLTAFLGRGAGWASGAVLVVLIICSTRNLLVVHRL